MFYLTKLLNEFQASQSFTHDENKLGHYNKDFGDGIAVQGYESKGSYQTDIPGNQPDELEAREVELLGVIQRYVIDTQI